MPALGSKTISFNIPINWLLSIPIAAITVIVAYVFVPTSVRPALVFGTAVVAGAAALTTAVNNVDQRAAALAAADKQAHHNRVVAAMSYIERWNSPTFFHCKKNCRKVTDYFREHPHIDDQMAYLKLEENFEKHSNLVDILNHFEALSIGISRNIVDEETASQFFRTIVLTHWHLTEGYIKRKRAERQNARLQKEFEALYERWKNN